MSSILDEIGAGDDDEDVIVEEPQRNQQEKKSTNPTETRPHEVKPGDKPPPNADKTPSKDAVKAPAKAPRTVHLPRKKGPSSAAGGAVVAAGKPATSISNSSGPGGQKSTGPTRGSQTPRGGTQTRAPKPAERASTRSPRAESSRSSRDGTSDTRSTNASRSTRERESRSKDQRPESRRERDPSRRRREKEDIRDERDRYPPAPIYRDDPSARRSLREEEELRLRDRREEEERRRREELALQHREEELLRAREIRRRQEEELMEEDRRRQIQEAERRELERREIERRALLRQEEERRTKLREKELEAQRRSITIKTLFSVGNSPDVDTRRFQLNYSDWDKAFADLREFVREMYGSKLQPGEAFSFQYTDDENDKVHMSTPLELRAAVTLALETQQSILKVHVTTTSPMQSGLRSRTVPSEIPPQEIRLRIHWDRGHDAKIRVDPSMTVADIKDRLGIAPRSLCVLNGRYYLDNHNKTAFAYKFVSGDSLTFWTNYGRLGVTRAPAIGPTPPGEPLTNADIPVVVMCDVRFNFLPSLCLDEILAGSLRPFDPASWLERMTEKHMGPIDGFEKHLEHYYRDLLSDAVTMNTMKRRYCDYMVTLIETGSSEQPFTKDARVTKDMLLRWTSLVRSTEPPWAPSSGPYAGAPSGGLALPPSHSTSLGPPSPQQLWKKRPATDFYEAKRYKEEAAGYIGTVPISAPPLSSSFSAPQYSPSAGGPYGRPPMHRYAR